MILRTGLSLALFVVLGATQAAHLPGGSIAYRCVGGNNHEITLTLYRECSGAPMVPQTLHFSNDCGVTFDLPGLLPQDSTEISPLCASELGASTCNGGTLIGLQAFTYHTTLYLSPCDTWTIGCSICCRNNSINVANTPGLWIEARLNNATTACDASPVLNEVPVPFVCVNQPVSYDSGTVDPDGNTVRYHFIDARYSAPEPTPVSYTFPYTGAEPFTGMVIDSLTGLITFTPTVLGYIVTAVQMDTYDANDVWIGSVMRDFPFIVQACSNTAPPIASGVLGNATGGAAVVDSHTARICQGGSFCMDAVFTDGDASQSLTLTSNVGVVFPGATFAVSGTNPATASICWDQVTADPGTYYVTVNAMDDACPVRGEQSYLYTVIVDGSAPDAGADAGVAVCSFAPAFALIDSLGGTPGTGGTWTDPNGDAHSGTFDPASDLFGDYTYTLGDLPCAGMATLSVTLLPPSDPLCMFLGTQHEVALRSFIAPNPSNGVFTVYGTATTRMDILDQQGRTVWSTAGSTIHTGWTITLPPSIANGSYFLRTFEGAQSTIYRIEIAR